MLKHVIPALSLLVFFSPARGQEPFPGETLISPMASFDTHLLDMDGNVVMTWHGSQRPKSMAYLLSDGSILRPCRDLGGAFGVTTAGGRIQRIDSEDNIVWDFLFSSDEHQQHHDIEPMPNGNVLLIAWERKTLTEAVAMGAQNVTGEIWPTLIVEVEPVGSTEGNIVWEWRIWDHLIQDVDPEKPNYGVIADHPELLNINDPNLGTSGDWMHENAIDYNPELDQIVICARKTNEIYIIDHSTTTEEAAGHMGGNCGMGGDFIYRWGNPQVYGRGSEGDRYFDVIHGVNWIDDGLPGAGNLLAFNNGDRPGTENDYSTVEEIVPPLQEDGTYYLAPDSAFGPVTSTWTFGGPGGFFGGPTYCGAFRLPNGNTLICSTVDGYVFEVTEAGATVWDYDDPNRIANAQRYWDDATAVSPDHETPSLLSFRLETNYPNPFNSATTITYELDRQSKVFLRIYDVSGRLVRVLLDEVVPAGRHEAVWNGRDRSGRAVAAGIYFYRLEAGAFSETRRMTLIK